MRPLLPPLLLIVVLVSAVLTPAAGQSVGRIRRSLDKATGGATRPATPGAAAAPAAASSTSTQAQIAANEAAANKRNKAAQAGVDDRVVAFLQQRIEDGSADAAFDLAKRYEEGKGVEADPVEARRLYELAAKRDNEEAKTWLQDNPEPEKPAVEKVESKADAEKQPDPEKKVEVDSEAKESPPAPQEAPPAEAPKP